MKISKAHIKKAAGSLLKKLWDTGQKTSRNTALSAQEMQAVQAQTAINLRFLPYMQETGKHQTASAYGEKPPNIWKIVQK